MRLEECFEVRAPREACAAALREDETLTQLFPDARTEIVARDGGRKTVVSHYRALGREGDATFHFDFEGEGDVRFAKVCDGRVWRRLEGRVHLESQGERTRVTLAMEGRTKGLVPEFAIKGPLEEQLQQMAGALRQRMEALG